MDKSVNHPARIVVIEDNPADVQLLRHALEEHGELFHLEVLPNGEAALQFVQDHCGREPGDPCLIVLDLHLPHHDGAVVLAALRRQPALAHVKVAVLTSAASPRAEAAVQELGIQLYRQKPMTWDEYSHIAAELIALCKEPLAQSASHA